MVAPAKTWELMITCGGGVDTLSINPDLAVSNEELVRAIYDGFRLLCLSHGVRQYNFSTEFIRDTINISKYPSGMQVSWECSGHLLCIRLK